MAWVASEERRKISENTKAALAKLKARGVKLGRPWHKEKGINKWQPLKEHDFVLDPGLPKGYL
jgi:DNA invertase Pin-like site-specific DNA recombinase